MDDNRSSLLSLAHHAVEAFLASETPGSPSAPSHDRILADSDHILDIYALSPEVRKRLSVAAGEIVSVPRGLGLDLQQEQRTFMIKQIELPLLTLFAEGLRAGWFCRGAVDAAAEMEKLFGRIATNGQEDSCL